MFQNYFASATELCCNNFIWTLMCVNLCPVMNVCNLWWRCLIMFGLGCMLVELRSCEVSSDYRVYMGSCPLAWVLSWSLIHLNSYKLDGSVTPNTLELNRVRVTYLVRSALRRGTRPCPWIPLIPHLRRVLRRRARLCSLCHCQVGPANRWGPFVSPWPSLCGLNLA